MRPRHEFVRDQLGALLRRHPGSRAADLAVLANTSLATITRALNEPGAGVLRVGRAGRTRYYLRRALNGVNDDIAVYRVNSEGQASLVGRMCLTAPEGSFLDVAALLWPVAVEFSDGIWPGLPYPLQDMRPQGFLGRSLARQVAQGFKVSLNPASWSDDDVLQVLTHIGQDCTGDLIVGDPALQRWLHDKTEPQTVIDFQNAADYYLVQADNASSLGLAGSSAAGEFPKFTALRELPGSATPHVIVKYSGQDASATVQRWSDLLICEHLALQAVATLDGVRSASSRILQANGRTFLEVERFDRHGLYGRSPLCSLATLEAAILDESSDDWVTLGQAMVRQGWLEGKAVHTLRLLTMFGRLIQNTDMHKGNLSFQPEPVLQLAPVYDMLPMAYAPLGGGELPQVSYSPSLPMPQDQQAWLAASQAASAFWLKGAEDARISPQFRGICDRNARELARLQALL
ncbi:MAG: type II toxin-antitoxin system HipA family toxin YjjJ [Rhodoferax sp.]|nr:type II toxin-antitoxin system HipA family toxin YjjJ [Rhodoferax sp.]